MADYAYRRRMMVDTQVRPSDVTKYPIISAMLSVPREAYVHEGQQEAAYVGENLELSSGRVLLEPRTFAKMLDVLILQNTDLVLDLGCGLGYSSAVIAQIVEAVVAVESDETLASEAETVLAEQGVDNVMVIQAPLPEGAPKHGPYDAIIVEGAVEEISDAIVAQLKDGGRIAALFVEGTLGLVRIGYKIGGEVSWRFAFNANAPVLPGFERGTEFAL